MKLLRSKITTRPLYTQLGTSLGKDGKVYYEEWWLPYGYYMLIDGILNGNPQHVAIVSTRNVHKRLTMHYMPRKKFDAWLTRRRKIYLKTMHKRMSFGQYLDHYFYEAVE